MTERRRTNRESSNFSVSINLCDTYNDNAPIGSPGKGRITDFSPYGACLHLDKIQCGNHHIFYTTQDHENHVVSIECETEDGNDSLVIFGNPAWFDLLSSDVDRARFKMGIEFLAGQDKETLRKFLARLAGRQGSEKGWLRRLFK